MRIFLSPRSFHCENHFSQLSSKRRYVKQFMSIVSYQILYVVGRPDVSRTDDTSIDCNSFILRIASVFTNIQPHDRTIVQGLRVQYERNFISALYKLPVSPQETDHISILFRTSPLSNSHKLTALLLAINPE